MSDPALLESLISAPNPDAESSEEPKA